MWQGSCHRDSCLQMTETHLNWTVQGRSGRGLRAWVAKQWTGWEQSQGERVSFFPQCLSLASTPVKLFYVGWSCLSGNGSQLPSWPPREKKLCFSSFSLWEGKTVPPAPSRSIRGRRVIGSAFILDQSLWSWWWGLWLARLSSHDCSWSFYVWHERSLFPPNKGVPHRQKQ